MRQHTGQDAGTWTSIILRAQPGRRFDLDRLRVLAFLLLAVTHTANLFVNWGEWPIWSGYTSWGLERIVLFVSLWRLPLAFFVAGAGAAFSLRRRGPGPVIWERLQRLQRLLPPLMGGVFLIVPLQVWMQARFAGLHWGFAVEFALAVSLPLAGTAAVVRWGVYPFGPMRLLFGLKPRSPVFSRELEDMREAKVRTGQTPGRNYRR